MADDIDIEEHDLLDNPRIKNIFPDILNIKTEVIDYEEDGVMEYDLEDQETYEYNTSPQDYDEDVPSLYQNRIILGTKPCGSTDTSSESEEDPEPVFLESAVVLEDWGPILDNSPCFCADCQILFPTENALDSHKMMAHSFLIAVGRNKAVKSTSKSSISARLVFESDANRLEHKENLCNHCNQVFPDEIALLKHSYELLPRKFPCTFCELTFDKEAVCKIHELTHSVGVVLRCPICSCHFRYTNKLTVHMLHQHGTELKGIQERFRSDYKCIYCGAKVTNNKTYNRHIFKRHSELYNRIVRSDDDDDDDDKFKCEPCNLTFPSAYSEKVHRAAQHTNSEHRNEHTEHFEFDAPIKMEPLSPKSCQLQKVPDSIKCPIPKSVLFKCKKCQIHFVSSALAMEHTKKCVLTKGDWKCKKCRRSFKLVERSAHGLQHEYTERFKIILIQENMIDKILYKCKTCKIGFDERTYANYHATGCSESDSIFCNLCNVHIHEQAITRHKKTHNDVDAFLIIDFINPEKLNQDTKPDESLTAKKEMFYYYCPSCKCYMKVNKQKDKHSIGKCKKYLRKCLCKSCGLIFSQKCYVTHKKEHKRIPHLKLSDLTFKNTQTGKKLNPPFPEFKKCNRCSVKFFSAMALKNHMCSAEEAKVCGFCGDKFSDLAYKLHVSFHEYATGKKVANRSIPELIKKYESLKIIWNILFLCETCDTILDCYDDVVEHCQNHFCNMESYNVTIEHCSVCDLKIVGKCYEKHKKLHTSRIVTKSSFKILPYKYESLLSDAWYDMFDTLANEQIDQILNKSRYRYTRNVRMDLLVDGPIDLTIHQCGLCKSAIDWTEIADHIRSGNTCNTPVKFACKICHLYFTSKTAIVSHEELHKTRQFNKENLRIITFNNEKDRYVNDSLRSKMNPEGLKFIRCQYCGKLINKVKYKKHVMHHKYYKPKLSSNQPKFLARPNFKNIKERMHYFYKCKRCGVCVFQNAIRKHLCSKKNQKTQCTKCHLWFRSSHLHKHISYHERFKLTKSNVCVLSFKDGGGFKLFKAEKERRRDVKESKITLYQCSDCSVCLHREMNIKRHICISSNYQKVCSLCEMPFHCTRMQLHERFHDDKEFSRRNIVVKKFKSVAKLNSDQKPKSISKRETALERAKVDKKAKPAKRKGGDSQNREFLRHVHNRFYKCSCGLLFITPSTFLEHVRTCPNDNSGVQCDTCGLVFHASAIAYHKQLNKCPKTISTIYIVTTEANTGSSDDLGVYRCYKCAIHYMSFRGLVNHIELNHVIRQKASNCDECGALFSTRSYPQHVQLHHKLRKLSLPDLTVYNVFNMSLMKALKDAPDPDLVRIELYSEEHDLKPAKRKLDNDVDVVDEKINLVPEVEKKIKLDPEVDEKISEEIVLNSPCGNSFQLYRCKVCHLNFLHRRTLSVHLSENNHNGKQFTCHLCGLSFTKVSLTRHIRLHHTQETVSSVKQENITNESQEIEDTDVDKIDTDVEKIDTDVGKIATDVGETTDAIVMKNVVNQIKKSSKLYKCSECDVYFLFSDACLDHVTGHTTLDPTEYIACKICDLQFLCEYLGSHMKGHREKTFNIDETIVEEYSFRDGSVKIDSYSALDRLKSKLVSTTTHFDNEYDKNSLESSVCKEKSDLSECVSNSISESDIDMVSANTDTEKVFV